MPPSAQPLYIELPTTSDLTSVHFIEPDVDDLSAEHPDLRDLQSDIPRDAEGRRVLTRTVLEAKSLTLTGILRQRSEIAELLARGGKYVITFSGDTEGGINQCFIDNLALLQSDGSQAITETGEISGGGITLGGIVGRVRIGGAPIGGDYIDPGYFLISEARAEDSE